jgi:hypothetical protein
VTVDSPVCGSSAEVGFPNGQSSAGSGIYIGPNADRIVVTGGSCEGNNSYGVDIANGATNTLVSGTQLEFNVVSALRNSANGSAANARIRDCDGYNPLGLGVTTPSVPATTVAQTNLTGTNCTVYITGGTVTAIKINGGTVLLNTPAMVYLPAGATISITYSSAPTWVWVGD